MIPFTFTTLLNRQRQRRRNVTLVHHLFICMIWWFIVLVRKNNNNGDYYYYNLNNLDHRHLSSSSSSSSYNTQPQRQDDDLNLSEGKKNDNNNKNIGDNSSNENNEEYRNNNGNYFRGCILWSDDNTYLVEWLAYHYHFLPLKRLIVGIDPKYNLSSSPDNNSYQNSSTSSSNTRLPSHIFDRYRKNGLMNITEIYNPNIYHPIEIQQEYRNNPNKSSVDLFRSRQRHFYKYCMQTLIKEEQEIQELEEEKANMKKQQQQLEEETMTTDYPRARQQKRTRKSSPIWTIILDPDEYIVLNTDEDNDTSKGNKFQINQVGSTVYDMITNPSNKRLFDNDDDTEHHPGCIPMHRVQYTNYESTNTTTSRSGDNTERHDLYDNYDRGNRNDDVDRSSGTSTSSRRRSSSNSGLQILSSTFEPTKYLTLRYFYRQNRDGGRSSNNNNIKQQPQLASPLPGKCMIDLSYLIQEEETETNNDDDHHHHQKHKRKKKKNKYFRRGHVGNPHRPSTDICSQRFVKIPRSQSTFLVHHYTGSTEQFTYRNSGGIRGDVRNSIIQQGTSTKKAVLSASGTTIVSSTTTQKRTLEHLKSLVSFERNDVATTKGDDERSSKTTKQTKPTQNTPATTIMFDDTNTMLQSWLDEFVYNTLKGNITLALELLENVGELEPTTTATTKDYDIKYNNKQVTVVLPLLLAG